MYSAFYLVNRPHQSPEARQAFYEIAAPCLVFIRNAPTKAQEFRVQLEDHIERVKLENELQRWHDGLESLVSRMVASGNLPCDRAINLLRIQHRVLSIWLSVCLSLEECAVDAHTADFEAITEFAAKINPNNELQSDSFSFEMQTVPPLYYTAVKCRVPSLRRRALDLLRLAPRREGLWNAHMSAQVAARVIEIEERGVTLPHKIPAELDRLHGKLMPWETDRIHNIEELPADMRQIQSDAQYPPDQIQVTFKSKPWGLAGEWYTFTEIVVC